MSEEHNGEQPRIADPGSLASAIGTPPGRHPRCDRASPWPYRGAVVPWRTGASAMSGTLEGTDDDHDQQGIDVKIFVSSVITGLEQFRDAAAAAALALGHEVKGSEDFGASTASPK